MSKVDRIELYHVDVPLEQHFHPSWIPGYPQTHVRYTLVRLTTDDGVEGIATGTAFSRERQGLGDLLGGFLLGVEATDLDRVRKRIREASYLGWRNWWLECAFWDLKAKLEGVPLYQLMQVERQTVERAPVYASSGERRTIDERRPYLDRIREMGIKAVKIRVKDPDRRDDVTILEQCRAELGDDYTLGVDANQGWPVSLFEPTPAWDLEYATEFGKACDELDIAWIEEPLFMHDWDGMAELRRRVSTPIAGGELHGDWHELRALFEHGCLDKYQPDIAVTGPTIAMQTMAECRKRNLRYSPHTWTCGIGLLLNIHAFAAWEQREFLEYPFEPPSWTPARREGIIPPIEVGSDGAVAVPQEPGLGAHIDERALRRWGKRFHVSTPLRVAVRTIRDKGLKTALELKRRKEALDG